MELTPALIDASIQFINSIQKIQFNFSMPFVFLAIHVGPIAYVSINVCRDCRKSQIYKTFCHYSYVFSLSVNS